MARIAATNTMENCKREEPRHTGPSGLACLSMLAVLFGSLKMAGAQFNAPGASAPVAPPVSQAFTDGFMEGRSTMGMNLGSPGKLQPNKGKADLADSAQELKDCAKYVDAHWDQANDTGRGKVAGEIETAVQVDQQYTLQLSQSMGVTLPNHSAESGYFSSPGHLNGEKAHAVKLLTDTAAELDTLIAAIPGDKNGSKLGNFVDNHAAVDVLPGMSSVRINRRSKQESARIPASIQATTASLSKLLMPNDPATEAKPTSSDATSTGKQ